MTDQIRHARPPQKKGRSKAIRVLVEELREVLDAFGWYGIGVPPKEEGIGTPAGAAVASSTANHPEGLAEPGADRVLHPDLDEGNRREDDENLEADEDEEDYELEIDTWDIQFAIDNAVSSLLKANIVLEFAEAKSAPELSEFFEALFGSEHDLTKQAEYFEELINGYDGSVSKDDLEEAYKVLEGILDNLKPRKKGKEDGPAPQQA